ncbi:hypothetical protein AB0O76_36530 [Streptomyces sp. NPDC086554]|uniref:hypothetical protein n=1 Tax=Streptomyces sp. NPDC086554 TaxID=3154864 RepID=UPI003416C2DD
MLDGSLFGQVLSTGLALPVLLCGLTPPDPQDPDVLAGWDQPGPLGFRNTDDPDDVFNFGNLHQPAASRWQPMSWATRPTRYVSDHPAN